MGRRTMCHHHPLERERNAYYERLRDESEVTDEELSLEQIPDDDLEEDTEEVDPPVPTADD